MIYQHLYNKPDTSGYGSHIPALKKLFSLVEINHAIELGMGHWSTPFLLDHVKQSLASIEMQEQFWYHQICEAYQHEAPIEWTPILALGKNGYDGIDCTGIDFAFSDGHGESRPQAVNYFMHRGVPIISGHDTESTWYGWHKVAAEKYGYHEWKHEAIWPATTIWAKDKDLIEKLKA